MTAVAEAPVAAQLNDEFPAEYEIIALDDLAVDSSYQRPLTSFWRTVRDKFNPALVGVFVVSERKDGSRHVIDGQTRMMAMKDLGRTLAPCLVYRGLNKKQEAALFAELQTQRRGMRTYDRFRAQMIAEKPEALEISRIVEDSGFVLSATEVPGKTILAIAALEKIYRQAGDEGLRDVLEVLRSVWGTEDKDAVNAQILEGLHRFLSDQADVDYDRLEARLRDTSPRLLINRAAQIREATAGGSNRATAVASAILNEYLRRR